MDTALLLAAIAVPLWLNIKATFLVCRDTLSEKPQKLAQLLLVWLVPLVGAIIVLGVHRREEKPSGTYPSETETDYDYVAPGGSLRRTSEVIDGD